VGRGNDSLMLLYSSNGLVARRCWAAFQARRITRCRGAQLRVAARLLGWPRVWRWSGRAAAPGHVAVGVGGTPGRGA
jgi:hypothetical protein